MRGGSRFMPKPGFMSLFRLLFFGVLSFFRSSTGVHLLYILLAVFVVSYVIKCILQIGKQ